MVISDKVYDVTNFIPRHPGGPSRIINSCGEDATYAYEDPDNLAHMDPSARKQLEGMKIGYIKGEDGEHNHRDDCWVTINGVLHDMTNFISKHPGGELAIINHCGKDGT